MKFYVFDAENYIDQEKESLGVYTYDTLNEAKASFHSKLGVAMKNKNCTSALVMVINSDGGVHAVEKYVAE